MKKVVKKSSSERGGAGVKFLITLLIFFLIGNAGINFIPVAYGGESMKQDMQTAVVQGLAAPSGISPVEMVKQKIQFALANNNAPQDAIIEVKAAKGNIQAHVSYTQEVPILPFGIFKYKYKFDHTATPTGFLLKS